MLAYLIMEKDDSSHIIEGYNGIMPLDMRDIEPQFRKDAIKQHEHDIAEYVKYQNSLSPRLRYENTILLAKKIHKLDQDAALKRHIYDEKEQDKKYRLKNNSTYEYAKKN